MDAKHYNGPDEREDVCTEDATTCECPECRKWRDNREGPERTFDEALGAVCDERERAAAAMRLKR